MINEIAAQNQAAALSDPTNNAASVTSEAPQVSEASEVTSEFLETKAEFERIFSFLGLGAHQINAVVKHIEQVIDHRIHSVFNSKKK